ELKENKTYLISNKLTVKSGKENSLDTLTLQTKIEDKSDASAPESISFTVKTKAEELTIFSVTIAKSAFVDGQSIPNSFTD
ncbi:hypothetical protein PO81_09375, partial [Vibrio parahaemolyticus]